MQGGYIEKAGSQIPLELALSRICLAKTTHASQMFLLPYFFWAGVKFGPYSTRASALVKYGPNFTPALVKFGRAFSSE